MRKDTHPNRYGVWIDHRKAVIVRLDLDGRPTHEVHESGLGRRDRFKGERTSKTGLFRHTLDRQPERQHRENTAFKSFVKSLLARLEKPNGILVMGPGDGRHILSGEIARRKSLSGVWMESKPVDKMTIPEIKRLVKEHFHAY